MDIHVGKCTLCFPFLPSTDPHFSLLAGEKKGESNI